MTALAWSLYPTLKPLYEQQRDVSRLERELDGLRERNAYLRRQVERLKTPAGVEEAARSNLGYVRPGERAYVVIEDTSSAEAAEERSAEATRGSWWHGLYESFFGGAR